MSYTARLSEQVYPLTMEYADSKAIGAHASPYVSYQAYHRGFLVVNVGEMQAGATLDIAIQQATTAAGTGVKAITSSKTLAAKAAVQLTQAAADSDSLVCIEFQTEELDVTNRFFFVRFVITVAGAAVEYSAILYGCEARFKPVPITNWQQIVD